MSIILLRDWEIVKTIYAKFFSSKTGLSLIAERISLVFFDHLILVYSISVYLAFFYSILVYTDVYLEDKTQVKKSP